MEHKQYEKIKKDAELISQLISNTSPDYRGLLLMEISNELRIADQYFTAGLILGIAEKYGYEVS